MDKDREKNLLTQQLEKYTKRAKEKVHDMDSMLAQLVLLDTALEEKKKDKYRKRETAAKKEKSKKASETKKKAIHNLDAGGTEKKNVHGTNSEEDCQRCTPITHRKVEVVGPSNILDNDFAPGETLFAKETAARQQTLKTFASDRSIDNIQLEIEADNQFSIEIETNDLYCLVENSSKNCLQCNLTLSDCDAQETLKRKRIKKQRKTRPSRKSERERRKHDYDYEEEALRRTLSLISIDSLSCETQTNLMKKENDEIPMSDNVYCSKINAAMKKSNQLSNDKSDSSTRKKSVTEDTQTANVDQIERNEAKCDPKRAYVAQQGQNLIKSSIDIGLEADCDSATVEQAATAKQAKEASNQLSNANSDSGSAKKRSVKMERKARTTIEEEVAAEIPNRVIHVENPRIKGRKKHKSKSAHDLKDPEKQKRKETKRMSRSNETIANDKESKRDKHKSPKKTKQKRHKSNEVESLKYSTAKDASPQQKMHQDKGKENTISSEEDIRVASVNKTKHQRSKSSTKSKLPASSCDTEQKQEQKIRKNSQEASTKHVSKRSSEKDLWFAIKPHSITDKTNQHARSSRASKKDERQKASAREEEISSQNKRSSRNHKKSLPTTDKPKKVEGRLFNATNWHKTATLYNASNPIRPELREWKGHDPDKTSYGASPPKRFVKTGSFSDSESSLRSSESSLSRDSALSSGTGTSSAHSNPEGRLNGYYPHLGKTNNKSKSPSNEINAKAEVIASNVEFNKHRSRPQRSASSTSSFLCYPIRIVDAKTKQRRENNNQTGYKTYENRSANKAQDTFDESRPPSPNDNIFEPKFGKRRTKRANACVVAEGEDGNSPWQQQQLVVISQKPGMVLIRKTGAQKAQQQSKPTAGNFLKSVSSGSDKRPQTIRDLYSLHNVLSDTQNGTVISGYRRNDGVRVAIKRISKAATSRWGKMNSKTVPLELALLCQVNESRCSGVVQVVEWHETNEAYLLVMIRPHPVVDLYDYVTKHKRVKESLARHMIRQLVSALHDCINCGVLHRDVKLENILLNPETIDITLIDFGCGDYVRTTPYKEFAGTPEYYPPEWFSRKQYHAEPMTAWSIGVLLYSLLCGTLPFRSATEIREKDANKFPSDVSRSARDLIGLLLQKNPRERLRLKEIFDHPWLSKSAKTSL